MGLHDTLRRKNPDLFSRTDISDEQKYHTAFILGLSDQIAALGENYGRTGEVTVKTDLDRTAARLGTYLSLYAEGVQPSDAIERACIAESQAHISANIGARTVQEILF